MGVRGTWTVTNKKKWNYRQPFWLRLQMRELFLEQVTRSKMIMWLHVGKIKEIIGHFFVLTWIRNYFVVFSAAGCAEGTSCLRDLQHEGVFTCLEDTKCQEDSNSFIFNHFFGSEYLDVEMELVSGKSSFRKNTFLWISRYFLTFSRMSIKISWANGRIHLW